MFKQISKFLGLRTIMQATFYAGIAAGAVAGAAAGASAGFAFGALSANKSGNELKEELKERTKALAKTVKHKSENIALVMADTGRVIKENAAKVKSVLDEDELGQVQEEA
jgi:gas vesicle protein